MKNKMTDKTKETKYLLKKETFILDNLNCSGIFYLPDEDFDIIELNKLRYKKQKLKFLKDFMDGRIEIFKDDKRCMVISLELWDNLKKIFNVFDDLNNSTFYIADKESPLIIKNGTLGGIIAPRVDDD